MTCRLPAMAGVLALSKISCRCVAAGVAWSSVEPWVFASVSYDGRVAVNRVPSQVKYKILI